MRITLQIPDRIFEQIQANAEKHDVRPATFLADLVKRFAAVDVHDRVVIVEAPERADLEKILGGGHLIDGEDLVKKVRSATDVLLEKVELEFTAGQKKELARKAERQGITYEEMIRRTVKAMEPQFFDYAT